MAALRRAFFDKLSALRPPQASNTRQTQAVERTFPAVLTIATPSALPLIARALYGSAATALMLPAGTHLARRPESSFARALIRATAARGVVSVGSRSDSSWASAARELGARPVTLGSAGWTRVELADHALLDAVYVPRELDSSGAIVAVADAEGARALGFWDSIVHPHCALQALVGGNRARMDLVAAISGTYAFTLGPRSASLFAWTDDPVAAELALLSARYLADERHGYEQRLPWEDARVQAAVERGLGAAGHHQLLVSARLGNTGGVALDFVVAVARLLGCALEVTEHEE